METNPNKGSYGTGFLVGALVGGAVGAIVALLFAPKSGKELRRDIADRSEDLVDKAQEFFTKEKEQVEDVVNEGRMKAERIVSSARNQAESLLSNAEQVLRDARSRAKNIKDKSEHE